MSKGVFITDRSEDILSRIKRFAFNFFPAYRCTGARICFISSDFREVHITPGLNWKTRNYVGSVFGGSIYSAFYPIYMVQLINILGLEYVVWDMSVQVKFIKPVKKKVYARLIITDDLIGDLRKGKVR